MKTRLLYFLFIGLLFSSCAKDIGYISGEVECEVNRNNNVLEAHNCQVTILPGGDSMTTDYFGDFISPALLPGEYTLTFSYPGYEDRSIKVTVIGGSVVNMGTIVLQRQN